MALDDSRTKYEGDGGEKERYLRKLSRGHSIIFTDNTMGGNFISKKFNSVYELFEEKKGGWVEQVKQVADHFKKEGKKIIINPYAFSHHLNDQGYGERSYLGKLLGHKKIEKLKERSWKERRWMDSDYGDAENVELGYFLAEYLGKNVKCLPYNKDFAIWMSRHKRANHDGNIVDVLKKENFDFKKDVVFVDHHIYDLQKEGVESTGFDKVKIYRICPCCIQVDEKGKGIYDKTFKERGFDAIPSFSINGETFYPQLIGEMKRLIVKNRK